MVTVNVPLSAVRLTVSVKVLVVAAGFGLNAAVTPLGRPEAVKLTLALKPFCGVMVIVLVPLAPRLMLKELGEAESVKSGAGVTVKESVVVLVRLPDVPVMVTVNVPVDAVALPESVRVLLVAVGFGMNEAVTPLGRPDADKFTLPLKPLSGVTVIVLVAPVPWVMLKLPGRAESVKFCAAVTVRVIVVVLVRLPDVPVIVRGNVPVVAEASAESVNVLLAVAGFGVNEAETPVGKPDEENVTLPLKPFWGVMVIALMPLLPCKMLSALGDADRVKLWAGAVVGQLFTRFAALTLPIPVAKSHPVVVPYAGLNEALETESTPSVPPAK